MQGRSSVSRLLVVIVFSLFVATLLLGACGGGGRLGQKKEPDSKYRETTVNMGVADVEYSTALSAVTKYVIEKGFGYTVSLVELTLSEAQDAVVNDTVHFVQALRQPSNIDWFDGAVKAGDIIDLGPVYVGEDGHSYNSAASTALDEMLEKDIPAVVKMLERMQMQTKRLKETDEWYRDNDIQPEERCGTGESCRAAVYFLNNFEFEGGWKTWMAYNPAEFIRVAIETFHGLPTGDLYDGKEIPRGRRFEEMQSEQ
jgi:ABC-type proline/glycine betaine transport system substrate-binding protein